MLVTETHSFWMEFKGFSASALMGVMGLEGPRQVWVQEAGFSRTSAPQPCSGGVAGCHSAVRYHYSVVPCHTQLCAIALCHSAVP